MSDFNSRTAAHYLCMPPLDSNLREASTARFLIRDYVDADGDEVNATALAAFSDYKDTIEDWPAMEARVTRMSQLPRDANAELIVATVDGRVAGAVGYVGPGVPKQEWFEADWPVIRMLVVHPRYRGRGIGRALTEECVRRARRDGAPMIALHTTPIMEVALGMYERMGFTKFRDCPTRYGFPYAVYVKRL